MNLFSISRLRIPTPRTPVHQPFKACWETIFIPILFSPTEGKSRQVFSNSTLDWDGCLWTAVNLRGLFYQQRPSSTRPCNTECGDHAINPQCASAGRFLACRDDQNNGLTLRSDDKEAKRLFHESISFRGGRYEVGWPWKAHHFLPDKYQLAKWRLTTLLHRFRREPETLTTYNHVLQEQLQAGIIEVAPPEVDRFTHRLHYLPHHPVFSPGNTTTKLRIVYDSSAKKTSTNNSLNECLYRGAILLQGLTGILLRFRLQRVAITADTEKAFLQLNLRPPDRDVTRFLWVKNSNIDNPTAQADNLQELRFARVP